MGRDPRDSGRHARDAGVICGDPGMHVMYSLVTPKVRKSERVLSGPAFHLKRDHPKPDRSKFFGLCLKPPDESQDAAGRKNEGLGLIDSSRVVKRERPFLENSIACTMFNAIF
ncbi:hypothetical protein GCM10025877_30650 [Agromyces mangrovi Wang et al. 2018]|nr:hypothetical protein GCM10025877_30650 [Agromyces mangrovi]